MKRYEITTCVNENDYKMLPTNHVDFLCYTVSTCQKAKDKPQESSNSEYEDSVILF